MGPFPCQWDLSKPEKLVQANMGRGSGQTCLIVLSPFGVQTSININMGILRLTEQTLCSSKLPTPTWLWYNITWKIRGPERKSKYFYPKIYFSGYNLKWPCKAVSYEKSLYSVENHFPLLGLSRESDTFEKRHSHLFFLKPAPEGFICMTKALASTTLLSPKLKLVSTLQAELKPFNQLPARNL